jgi:hypothetical protein
MIGGLAALTTGIISVAAEGVRRLRANWVRDTRHQQLSATVTATAHRHGDITAPAAEQFSAEIIHSIRHGVGIISITFHDLSIIHGTAWITSPRQGPNRGNFFLVTAAHVLTSNGNYQVQDIKEISFLRPGVDNDPYTFEPYEFHATAPNPAPWSPLLNAPYPHHDLGAVGIRLGHPVGWQEAALPYMPIYRPPLGQHLLAIGYPYETISGDFPKNQGVTYDTLLTVLANQDDGRTQAQGLAGPGMSGAPVIAIGRQGPYVIGTASAVDELDPSSVFIDDLEGLDEIFANSPLPYPVSSRRQFARTMLHLLIPPMA